MARLPRAPRVKLEITQEIIDDAIPRDSSHCLWAEAVKAAVPDATRVSVDLQTIRFSDPKKGLRFTYLTPRAAQIAIVQWDQGIKPEPHGVQLRAGQVTPAGKKITRALSDVEMKQRKTANAAAVKKNAKTRENLKKAGLRAGTSGDAGVPERTGGKTPPIGPGRRRSFGLRALEY
jgi:hypothetical protein